MQLKCMYTSLFRYLLVRAPLLSLLNLSEAYSLRPVKEKRKKMTSDIWKRCVQSHTNWAGEYHKHGLEHSSEIIHGLTVARY